MTSHEVMDAESIKAVLAKARKLIERRENWTQRDWARTGSGDGTHYDDPAAICFCLAGAVRVAGATSPPARTNALRLLKHLTGHVTRFNDDEMTQHADVLAMLDRALEQADDFVKHGATRCPVCETDSVVDGLCTICDWGCNHE